MRDRPPDWSDLDGLRALPCAVLVRLPDGAVVAIWGNAERVTQYANDPDPQRDFISWSDDVGPRLLGVHVKWDRSYRMTWHSGPMPADPPPTLYTRRELAP